MNEHLFERSDELAAELTDAVSGPLWDDSPKLKLSDVACSMSLEHWHGCRLLFSAGLLPTGVVTLRAQYEALVRSLWVLYAASDSAIEKLSANLTMETEQAAKNLPLVAEMIAALAGKAPPNAIDALTRFKDASWKALNSYAHAGLHPLRRHADGYPVELIHAVLRNSNTLAIVAFIQAIHLTGREHGQKVVMEIAQRYPECLGPRL